MFALTYEQQQLFDMNGQVLKRIDKQFLDDKYEPFFFFLTPIFQFINKIEKKTIKRVLNTYNKIVTYTKENI